jgi:DNA (cytosine-5)-methyltransferase 1
MSTMTDDITASVETIDLTGDDATEPTRGFLRDHAAEPKHQSFPRDEEEKDEPEIDLNDFGDDETDDGDDYIREITPNEFLKRTLEERTPSATTGWTGQYDTEADITESGVIVKPGICVELKNQEFLLIKKLFRRENNVTYLKGILFIRTRSVMNMLPKKHNEVCAIVKARADTKSKMPDIDAYLVTRRLSDVICQRTLILTNQPFPIHSFREKNVSYPSWNAVDDNAELVCRYKHVEFCDTVTWKVPSEALVRLRRHECDIGVPDAQLMFAFRRTKQHKKTQATPTTETRTKLAATKAGNKRTIADVTTGGGESEEVTSKVQQTYKRIKPSGVYERQTSSLITERFTHRHNGRQRNADTRLRFSSSSIETASLYVYGDICAGAGGATIAAQRAGFIIKFALDHAADPCATLRKNFPNATIREEDIYSFCNRKSKGAHVRVDVLHISFPCQPYSIAHTHEGKNDETNVAAGYSVIPLLKKCRPRIVTFEQSPNITKPKHRHSFEALIHQVTDMGYSVRWKVVNFADTGNAQSRNRLFIIASW